MRSTDKPREKIQALNSPILAHSSCKTIRTLTIVVASVENVSQASDSLGSVVCTDRKQSAISAVCQATNENATSQTHWLPYCALHARCLRLRRKHGNCSLRGLGLIGHTFVLPNAEALAPENPTKSNHHSITNTFALWYLLEPVQAVSR